MLIKKKSRIYSAPAVKGLTKILGMWLVKVVISTNHMTTTWSHVLWTSGLGSFLLIYQSLLTWRFGGHIAGIVEEEWQISGPYGSLLPGAHSRSVQEVSHHKPTLIRITSTVILPDVKFTVVVLKVVVRITSVSVTMVTDLAACLSKLYILKVWM